MKKLLILLFIIVGFHSTHAAETAKHENKYKQKEAYEAEIYKSESDVFALLQEKGIKTTDINWQEVENACLNIQSSTVKTNKCRYEKSIDQYQYKSDTSYCNSNKAPYSICMYERGWNNPDSWLMGRRDEQK